MKEIIADVDLVAYCGLYCGACKRYLHAKCPGCQKNEKATWCKVRECCRTEGILTCAECRKYSDVLACRAYNNVISKIFGFIFRSDRAACIRQIQKIGIQNHAMAMADMRRQSLGR